MTGKERAAFRAQANSLECVSQLGKGGVTEAFVDQLDKVLTKRELIKFRVFQETSPVTPREAADDVSAKLGAEVIQVIGGVVVLYRYNPELHEKPKKPAQNPKELAEKKREYYQNMPSKKEILDRNKRKRQAASKAGRRG